MSWGEGAQESAPGAITRFDRRAQTGYNRASVQGKLHGLFGGGLEAAEQGTLTTREQYRQDLVEAR